MKPRRVAIASTGIYLPAGKVTSQDTALRYGREQSWVERSSGISLRHKAGVNETASYMGAEAAKTAAERAGISLNQIDCIVCTSGCPEQSFPCTAALVQRQLGLGDCGIPAFDINSSCLSFVTGIDTMSYLVDAGRYKNVLLVASEICAGVDFNDPDTGMLFGDGAAAALLVYSPAGSSAGSGSSTVSEILASSMQTFGNGAHFSQCLAGGNRFRPEEYQSMISSLLFKMDGKALYKLAAQYIPPLVQDLLDSCGLSRKDIDLVIPHQASLSAMHLIRRHLEFEEEKWIDILSNHGNTIAASIPISLDHAIATGRLKRGDIGLMLGTAAGFSTGAILFRY